MHPAPSLVEAPPKHEEPRSGQQQQQQQQQQSLQHAPTSPESHVSNGSRGLNGIHAESASPPVRKDTMSSTATNVSMATLATMASGETAASAYSVESSSPNFSNQSVFSVKDGTDVANNRRPASRRRTGPLSAVQRERAALIRKLGACGDCRRRRVACHPNHHNMSWEDARRKYRSHSPSIPELAPLTGRALSPVPVSMKPVYTHESQDMEIDSSTSLQQQLGRTPLSDARIRTPLPSGPRLDKPAILTPLPGSESFKMDLQTVASKALSNPYRRYASVQVLLLYWQDDEDRGVIAAMEELCGVLDQLYHYTFEIKPIPTASDGYRSSWNGNLFRWLSREISDFIDNRDQRDVLKIVYYNGHTYLNRDRDMVLARSRNADPASTIRWSGIQQNLESACSDVLIIMDAAYYPSSQLVRNHAGVLELIAASASEDHIKYLDRSAFTRALTEQLRTRASQKSRNPLSAAELHAKLLACFPKMIQDRHPEKEMVTSFPSPLHMQVSGGGNDALPILPSIWLAPAAQKGGYPPYAMESPPASGGGGGGGGAGAQVTITFQLVDESVRTDSWAEWLRLMPEGIRDVKVDGPYRNTFR